MKPNKKSVGMRIFLIRSEVQLSGESFGGLVDNASKSLVSKWEKGQCLPNTRRIKMISDIGGITVDELLYGKKGVEYDFSQFTTEELLDEVRRRVIGEA